MSRNDHITRARHTLEQARRKVDDLERLIREMEMAAAALDQQILAEEDRTGIRDRKQPHYSTLAKAATERRDKLKSSIDALHRQLDSAIQMHDRASEEFNRLLSRAQDASKR